MVQFLIYNFAEHNGTAITNHGGSGYAGAANRDMWVLRNGRGTYGPFGSSDRITIADGTYQQTITSHSWEFWFYVNGRGANGTYEHLWDDNYGGLIIEMQNTPPWTLTVYRRTNASDAVYWCFETIDFQPGHDYYVQIAGNFGTNPQNTNLNSVHVHIGIDGAAPTHYPSHVIDFYKGAGTAWFPHDSNLPTLGNSPALGNNANVYFIRVREYNEVVNWDVAGDWQADVVGSLESTYLTMEADDYSPTIGQTVNFVTTLKDSSGNGIAGATIYTGYFLYYENDDNAWVDLYSADTIEDGTQSFAMPFDGVGHRYFNTEFHGESSYQPSISPDIDINVTTEEIDQSVHLLVFNSGQTGALSPTVSTGVPTSVITGGQFAAIAPVVTIDDNMIVHVAGTIDSDLAVLPASTGTGFEIVAEMIRYNSYPLYQESDCVIKFSSWPASGTIIPNEGVSGSELSGIAVDNDYELLDTGATSFHTDDVADCITVGYLGV